MFSEEWYDSSVEYWKNIPDTVDGMLGGMGYLDEQDVAFSLTILQELGLSGYVCDCGSGIGRVSKNVHSKIFSEIDVVEPIAAFIEKAKEAENVKYAYNVGLEKFVPTKLYDCIWAQWVLNYIKDEDLVEFFKRCLGALKPGGVLVLKENILRANHKDYEWDTEDSSVTRSDALFKRLITSAGGRLIREATQPNFPNGLFPVKVYAIKPR